MYPIGTYIFHRQPNLSARPTRQRPNLAKGKVATSPSQDVRDVEWAVSIDSSVEDITEPQVVFDGCGCVVGGEGVACGQFGRLLGRELRSL